MKQPNKFLLLLLFAVLAIISWPPLPTAPLLLVAWIPLFLLQFRLMEEKAGKWKHLGFIFLAHLLWNVGTTWWVWNSTAGGSVAAFVANSLLMSAPWMLWRWLESVRPARSNAFWFIATWISFEFFHLNWEGTWPWLTIGNGMASTPILAQWYEYTGALGGTLWILSVNLLAAFWLNTQPRPASRKPLRNLALLAFVPMGVSIILYFGNVHMGLPESRHEALIIQPNIDPYNGKFSGSPSEQLEKHLRIAEPAITPYTRLLIFPETAMVGNMRESQMERSNKFKIIRDFQSAHPQIAVLTGAETIRVFELDDADIPVSARRQEDRFVDYYNTALYIKKDQPAQVYHKSKLVPGVERMPYAAYLGFLESLSIDMGGTSGSLGVEAESKVFRDSGWVMAPIICYESIFGDYVRSYTRKGANLLIIITNDGWWENTPGHVQHLQYASLRAIENRRMILRSANTGISAVVYPDGSLHEQLGWWQEGVIPFDPMISERTTLYVLLGDWIGWLALAAFAFGLLRSLFFRRKETPAA